MFRNGFSKEAAVSPSTTYNQRYFDFRLFVPWFVSWNYRVNRRFILLVVITTAFWFLLYQLRSMSVPASVRWQSDTSPGGHGAMRYSTVQGFFLQSDKKTDPNDFDYERFNFGLKHRKYRTDHDKWVKTDWQRFEEYMTYLRESSNKRTDYKVLWLMRHGQGFHNVAEAKYGTPAWEDYWSKMPDYADARLTEEGKAQAQKVQNFWMHQLKWERIPLPESFYVSPLARCLETARLTYSSLDLPTSKPFKPLVKEMAREKIGIHTCDRRSTKSWIHATYPSAQFDADFTEADQLWRPDSRETDDQVDIRQRIFLDDIFLNDTHSYIAVTSHSGTIQSMLRILGHQEYPLPPGGILPVLVKAQKTS